LDYHIYQYSEEKNKFKLI
jgi:hypothetical protein